MEHGSAPLCVGSIFPAPQLITESAVLPFGPLLFDQCERPRCILNVGCPLTYGFNQRIEKPSLQVQDFLGDNREAFFPREILLESLQEDASLNVSMAQSCNYIVGSRLEGIQRGDGMLQLFFPAGPNIDKIGSCTCFPKSDGMVWSKGNVCGGDGCTLPFSLSSSVRQPILQIAAVRKESCEPTTTMEASLAVRTSYQVHWLTSQAEFCAYQDESISFGSKGVATFEHHTSHVAWNPHVPEEAAVILENGDVQIFDLKGEQCHMLFHFPRTQHSIYKTVSSSHDQLFNHKHVNKKKRGQRPGFANIDSSPFEKRWWSCEYAWHPQTLLVAGYYDICLIDLRHKVGSRQFQRASARSTLATIDCAGGLTSFCNQTWRTDHFTAFARADYDGMYQFAAASKHHLQLFDVRQPHTPILQWEHGMQHEAPGLLQMCPMSDLRSMVGGAMNMASREGRVILACACKSGDIHAFCYGPQPQMFPTAMAGSGSTNHTHNSALNEILYSWGLPSKLNVERVYFGDTEHTSEAHEEFGTSRNFAVLPNSQHPENILGLFKLSSTNLDPLGFTMFQLTGSGAIVSQKYKACTNLDTTEHGKSQAFPQSFSSIQHFSGQGKSRQYFAYEHMPSFLSYVRNGSVWPAYVQSNFLSNTNEYLHSFERWHASIKADAIKDILFQLLNRIGNPLSIYEISSKVLWRTLPCDHVQKAVEKRNSFFTKRIKSCAGLDLPEISPMNDLCALVIDATDLHGMSNEKVNGIVKPALLGPSVPLPVMLENQQFSQHTTSYDLSKQGAFETDGVHLSLMAEKTTGSQRRINSLNGHNILLSMCSRIAQVINGFRDENLVLENTESVVSLADPLNLWSDSLQSQISGSGQFLLFHVTNATSWLDDIPFKALPGKPVNEKGMDDMDVSFVDACSNAERHVGGSGSFARTTQALPGSKEKEDDVYYKTEFYNFVGSKICKLENGLDERSFRPDVTLCPVTLKFKESGDSLGSKELQMLNSLKENFEKWQTNFQPYVAYCHSHVYKKT